MFKVKLLILLLISSFFYSCNTTKINNKISFNLAYIGGEEDGLIFSNLLRSYLTDFGLYDPNSRLVINANIAHERNLYITNVDNTSDREKVTSRMNIEIFDQLNNCTVFIYASTENQFYVITDTVNFISNNMAVEQIKFRNNEALIQKFIHNIADEETKCIDTYENIDEQ